MRLLPDHLSVAVVERTPVAFVRLGSSIGLVDADGVLLSLPPAVLAARHYSFPVVTGLAPADRPDARAGRMQLYQRFVRELDSGGQNVSNQLSEVDLSDPEDVRVIVPAQGNDLLLHFGDSEFLTRYHSYQAHLSEWRQQYPHLSSIDLRYDRQVVLKMADGAESEAGSVPVGNSLTAAPAPAVRPATHSVHHPAGHGKAHGWRPQ
jgi:cell division protein FtsQ